MSRYCGMCRELHDERGPWCRDCQHAYGHGRERGRAEERAAVVAWLRREAAGAGPPHPVNANDTATAIAGWIERCAHIPKEPKRHRAHAHAQAQAQAAQTKEGEAVRKPKRTGDDCGEALSAGRGVVTPIDDYIDDPASNAYAAKWFRLFRRPALDKMREPNDARLFTTYNTRRWRVMGCSRLGDVWLNVPEHEGENGYVLRIDVAGCSDWSAEP